MNRASQSPRDGLCDGQPKSAAAGLSSIWPGAIESLKNVRKMFGRDTQPLIVNVDPNCVIVAIQFGPYTVLRGEYFTACQEK